MLSEAVSNLSSTLDELIHCKDISEQLGLLEMLLENLHSDCHGITESSEGKEYTYEELSDAETYNLIAYVFVSRYGWSEGAMVQVLEKKFSIQINTNGSTCVRKVNRGHLDHLLDKLIAWFSKKDVSVKLLQSYLKLVSEASDLPIVRNQTVVHVLTWLQDRSCQLNEENCFSLLCEFLTLTLTDVWSAIRKASSSRLERIICGLSESNLEKLWNKLVLCSKDTEFWQTAHGGIMGVCSIVQYLQGAKGDTTLSYKDYEKVPLFIQRDILEVVFGVISHSQLPIREAAVKVITAYISIVEQRASLHILEQTVDMLQEHMEADNNEDGSEFVDAYRAEGLLNICQCIVKSMSLTCLLPRWEDYLTIFLHNLSHPASSVRQSASSVFKLLVQKSSDNTHLFCQLLHTLTEGWEPVFWSSSSTGTQKVTWEGREGRMFVYEVICSFLIKNHIKAMFRNKKTPNGEEIQRRMMAVQNNQSASKNLCPHDSSATQLSLLARMKRLDNGQGNGEHTTSDEIVCAHKEGTASINCRSRQTHTSSMLLEHMLYQSVDCLSDKQWELNRIAGQVLPCIAEVIRWFDTGLLEHIWTRHFTSDTSITTYMSLFLLKESLCHCIRLEQLLQNSLDSIKITELLDSVKSILACVTQNNGRYLPNADRILNRPRFDKLSIMAAETLLMTYRLFDIDLKLDRGQGSSILQFWQKLFVFAHPHNRITRDLLETPDTEFSSSYEGYLSCCLVKPNSESQCAKQVEKLFVKKICCHLQLYLSYLPWTEVTAYLPLIMHNVGLVIDDTSVSRTLLRCVSVHSRNILEKVLVENSSGRNYSLKCIYYTLREAAGIASMKSVDSQLLQKVLNVYLVLCQNIRPSKHLKVILRAVCARLNKTNFLPENVDMSPRPETDASLLWQESQLSWVPTETEESELVESDSVYSGGDLPALYSECLSLNMSSTSSELNTSGRQRTLSDTGGSVDSIAAADDADDSDDWDSWSEEERDDSNVIEMLSTFLKRLKQSLVHNAVDPFDTEVSYLSEDEKKVILPLLSES